METQSQLKVVLIGIGNAGCQAAELAKKQNHQVFCINSSQKDLDDRVLDKSIPSFLIGNKRGAGKDRQNAKRFMMVEMERLFNNTPAFTDIVDKADVVVVAVSTGGGTGSGAGPLLVNRLMTLYPNKVVIFFGILPKLSESPQAQFNAIECLNEVTNPKLNMTYMLSDLHYFEDKSNEESYRKTAEYIVDCLNVIRGDYTKPSPYGMIDESDMLTILATPGYMMINHVPSVAKTDIENRTVQSIMIDMIKNSPAVPQQKGKIVRNVGIILNTLDQQDDPCKSGNYSELEEYIGHPLAAFTNYVVESKPRMEIALIMSGMNKPIDRISECTESAKQCEALFHNEDLGSVEDELSDLLAIKESRNNMDRNRIIGSSDAKSDKSVLSDIPDIF